MCSSDPTFRYDESGVYESGVCFLGSGVDGKAIIGDVEMAVSGSSITLLANTSGSGTFNGTLRFYKLGTIA